MDKKNQRLLWPSDSEFDDLSISRQVIWTIDYDNALEPQTSWPVPNFAPH